MSGYLPADICPPLVGPAGGGTDKEAAEEASRLAGDAGGEVAGGEERAAEGPAYALHEPSEERGL